MTFSKGEFVISVDQIDGFGKNPGLWIGRGNSLLKVASFSNADKAKLFEQYLRFFLTNEPMQGSAVKPDYVEGWVSA